MNEYKVKGLSCANCAQMLEGQIRKLEHGQHAVLSFNSARLTLDPRVSLERVESILKSDGAYLLKEHDDSHEESHHHHHHGRSLRYLLIASTLLFAAAIFLNGSLSDYVVIPMYLIAITLSGYTTFLRGLKNLFSLTFTIDTLMTIALIGAIAIGEWKEATLVAILFGLNEWLEGLGMEKARRSMESLLKVAPKEALLLQNDHEIIVPISSLKKGDMVRVKPGEKIPSDGAVILGKSSVNESAITGESLPVEKTPGQFVYGGSINNEGVLQIQIEKAYKDSSLAKILHLVQEAQDTKTPTELFINRFAKVYTPLIMIIAVLVIIVPPLFLNGEWRSWLYQGLAVLIVGCPCALILSSPIAIISGITRNARNGILVKGGVFLEQLGKIDTFTFDKTGTLTKGQPYVEQVITTDKVKLYSVAASIEKSSSHPLAGAIMKKVEAEGFTAVEPDEIQTISGQGIKAIIKGKPYWLGNEKSMTHLRIPDDVQQQIDELKERGMTLVLAADDQEIIGMFGISDEIREESKQVVAALHQNGIRKTVMLTGDHYKTAEKVAAAVGVTAFYSNLLPEDKVNQIKALSQQGRVAMVGDGMNDAPALATAHLGIAMGKGTDSAIETADIVLMQDHLGKLPEAVITAKRVNRIIQLNIAIALGLKLVALLLTIPGLLTLWFAILSDMGATIFVTLVSLTILLQRKKRASLMR